MHGLIRLPPGREARCLILEVLRRFWPGRGFGLSRLRSGPFEGPAIVSILRLCRRILTELADSCRERKPDRRNHGYRRDAFPTTRFSVGPSSREEVLVGAELLTPPAELKA